MFSVWLASYIADEFDDDESAARLGRDNVAALTTRETGFAS